METVVETEEMASDGDDEEYGVCADGSIQRREWSRGFLTVWSLVLQLLGTCLLLPPPPNTHTRPSHLSGAGTCLLLPPTPNTHTHPSHLLTVWSLVIQLLGMWCGVNMRVAMDSGLYEVFPFKGERVKMSGAMTVWFTFSFVCIIAAFVSHA